VFSVYRLCLQAKGIKGGVAKQRPSEQVRQIPIGMINIGESRVDSMLDFKIEAHCGRMLAGLRDRLAASGGF
jgi:hypothetical protein